MITVGTVDIESGRNRLEVGIIATSSGDKVALLDYFMTASEAIRLGELLTRAGWQVGRQLATPDG